MGLQLQQRSGITRDDAEELSTPLFQALHASRSWNVLFLEDVFFASNEFIPIKSKTAIKQAQSIDPRQTGP
jgi:hypothetical protein